MLGTGHVWGLLSIRTFHSQTNMNKAHFFHFCQYDLSQIIQEILLDVVLTVSFRWNFLQQVQSISSVDMSSDALQSANDCKLKGSQVSAADIGAFFPHSLILKSPIGNGRRCEATGCLKKVAGGKSLSPGFRNGCNLKKKNKQKKTTHTQKETGVKREKETMMCLWLFPLSFAPTSVQMFRVRVPLHFLPKKISPSRLFPSSSSRLSLALERPGRWFADLHGDICVQRVPLDLNHSVGQRADAVLLHRVLRVLYFIKSGGWQTKRRRERGGRGKMERQGRKTD